jgi:hypothetical protein
MKHASLILAALVFGAGNAAAQNAAAYDRARASLPPEQARAFEQIVESARARGLPIEPLADKVLEGRAKGVAPTVIINVVRARSDQLAAAAAVLPSGRVPASEITIVADAMQRGVKPEMVKKVHAGARPNEPVGMALNTLADLLERGVPVDVAYDVLDAWRNRGGRASQLGDLPATVERLIREGAKPEHAGAAVISALRAGRSATTARVGNSGLGRGKGPPLEPPGRGRGKGNGSGI